jgi:hypothetical protein
VKWPVYISGRAAKAIIGLAWGVALKLLCKEEDPVSHDKETRMDPTECARLARRIREALRRRNLRAGSEAAFATREDLAPVVSSSKQPPDQAEFCSPWAA